MEFPAHRYRRRGMTVFVLALPIRAALELLPIPDPLHKFPGNRRVDPAHAYGFASYWQENARWATPPLLVDTEYVLSDGFQSLFADEVVESGRLAFPPNAPEVLEILDGQHRILGWHSAAEEIRARMAAADRALRVAYDSGDRGGQRSAETTLETFAQLSTRLDLECVTLEIFEGIGLDEHRQFFSDIATNAKGISKSQVAAFDQRDLVNRVAAEIAQKHPLVSGVVDFEKDRMASANANLLSAKTLVDVVRAASIGFESRAAQKREALLDPDDVRDVTMRYLDVLVDEVPSMRDVATGEVSAAQLRETSLIASATILRVLAGAFRLVAVAGLEELRPRVDDEGEHMFRRMLRRLSGSWAFPIDERWIATGYFPSAASRAPSSRAQDLKGLTLTLAAWAQAGVPVVERR